MLFQSLPDSNIKITKVYEKLEKVLLNLPNQKTLAGSLNEVLATR